MTSPEPIHFARYPWYRRWFGQRSERATAKYLRSVGMRIIAQNHLDAERRGEIDLLAVDGETLVIVEVRSTQTTNWERTAESINHEKQRRLTEAALRFLKRRKLIGIPVRFDVVILCWPPEQVHPEIRHFRNAFQAVGRYQFFN
jgi:putative endonuclease